MISFCTPVKGRLEYLKQTYLDNLQAARSARIPAEFVLLDYDSPDGLADWARASLREFAEMVCFFKLAEPRPHYAIPVADNCAMKLARGKIVSNLMADTRVSSAYFRNVYELIATDSNRLVRPERQARTGTTGLMTMWKERFLAIGGYDEEMQGWGYQDVDLRHRCKALKMKLVYWSASEAEALPHEDELRTQFAGAAEPVSQSNRRNIERSKQNVLEKKLVANAGKAWGEARVERIAL